jgi:hypothetical protein
MKTKALSYIQSKFHGTSILAYGAFAAILFGVKLWLIGSYGNAMPYLDQWDGEAAELYRPFLDGTLSWGDLFSAHNEHRIFTTRLLDLILLNLNGIWNPLLQMVVNAALHIVTLIFGIVLLTRVIGKNYLPVLLAFSLVLFGIPFGWENTLWGFQLQFYFVLLFSIACLWLTVMQPPLSSRWWIGIFCAILAFLSLASGIISVAASAIIGLIFYTTGLRKTRQQLIAVAILIGIFIIGWILTPTVARLAIFGAHSIPQFFDALKSILSWPMRPQYVLALILNAPNLIFSGLILWRRPALDDRKWFLLALIAWTIGQAAGISYGRADGNLHSRYLDLFSLGILVNFASLISIAQNKFDKFNNWKIIGVSTWVLIILASLSLYAYEEIPQQLNVKRYREMYKETQTKHYLATGDFNGLLSMPWGNVPYPEAAWFASLLASPNVAAILPANIRPALEAISIESNPIGAFVVGGVSPKTPKRTEMTLGSFSTSSNAPAGQASLRFDAKRDDLLAIPVAGYPLAGSNKIEIIQNGQQHRVTIGNNPENSWAIAYAHVDKGPFSLFLSTSSNAGEWFAIEAPYVIGRLDGFIKQLLDNYFLFILLGMITGLALLTQQILVNRANIETRE